MSEQMQVTVRDNTEQHRYEATTDAGMVAGFAQYKDSGGVRVFTHTEVDEAFEGQGVGSELARGALDQVREQGLAVRIRCAFIQGYVDEHPDYADLQT